MRRSSPRWAPTRRSGKPGPNGSPSPAAAAERSGRRPIVAVLAYFLRRLDSLLGNIVANLGKIADGVEGVDGHCAGVGPGADRLNELLASAAAHLDTAGREAEALGH